MPYERPETKDNILSLAVAFPEACQLVIQRLMRTKAGLFKFSVMCDFIGLEYCKQIFDGLTEEQWTQVFNAAFQVRQLADLPQVNLILLKIYTLFLTESMAWEEGRKRTDPFFFLRKQSVSLVRELLRNAEPTHIALVSLYWKSTEFIHLLRLVEPSKRKLVVLQCTRLQQLPNSTVQSVAEDFANSLLQRAECNQSLTQNPDNQIT